MRKFFEKKEILFAVFLILVYVIGASIMNNVSEAVGILYFGEFIWDVVLTPFIVIFIKRNGLFGYLGLCGTDVRASKMLFYIPLFVIGGLPAVFGVGLGYEPLSLVFHTLTMLFAGFLEEVIFRGFLFKGMAKQSVTRAVTVSAVTFGIGHIVNLLNGYDIFDSITQIAYAVSVGFMLIFIFMRTGSIVPCIAFHIFNNVLTGFCTGDGLVGLFGNEQTGEIILVSVMIVITLAYTFYVVKALPKRELTSLPDSFYKKEEE